MSLQVDTSRALRTDEELHELVRAVETADAEDENEWIEWKSDLDLRAKVNRATLARHIIGMANRRVKEAARFAQGFGYILVGVEPGYRCGVDRVDPADFRAGIAPYLGPYGPRWTARYDTRAGPSVLIIIVDPPEPGDPIHALCRDYENYHVGDIFVRKLGSTEKADPGDHDYLAHRRAGTPGSRKGKKGPASPDPQMRRKPRAAERPRDLEGAPAARRAPQIIDKLPPAPPPMIGLTPAELRKTGEFAGSVRSLAGDPFTQLPQYQPAHFPGWRQLEPARTATSSQSETEGQPEPWNPRVTIGGSLRLTYLVCVLGIADVAAVMVCIRIIIRP